MFSVVLPYLVLLVILGSAVVLLTSKKLSEKFVTAGILPKTFLGIIPILQLVSRIFGGVLIAAGLTKVGIDSGWIDSQLLYRYAFSGCLILLGTILLFFSRRD